MSAVRRAVGRRAALGLAAASGLLVLARPTLGLDGDRQESAVAALRHLLDVNILPFWRRVCSQASTEGYELPILPPGNRTVILQARTTFFFSRLARSRHGRPSDLAIADRGFEFLTRRMWDAVNGGFFAQVAATDPYAPTARAKQLIGHAHALSAFSEYALARPSREARDWADLVAGTIDGRFRDAAAGDYADSLNEDWSGSPPATRGYNARLRMVDALTSYLALKAAYGPREDHELARDRLAEAVRISDGALVTEPARYFRASTADNGAALVTYNADLQAVHQLRRAREALGLEDDDRYSHVIDDALCYGEDQVLGGIFVAGKPGQPAEDRTKLGFAQAEALLGTCDSWVRTGDERHGEAFWRTLRWILTRQADWASGDWHPSVPSGFPDVTKASPFHPGRAVLYALELLEDHLPRHG